MLRYEADSQAPAAAVWELLARPAHWHEWAPHLRGAWRLDRDGVVREGARGAVRLFGVVAVPARVTAVRARGRERSWTWRVGGVEIDHRVGSRGRGSRVVFELRAPAAVEAALRVSYGPLVAALARRLAHGAER